MAQSGPAVRSWAVTSPSKFSAFRSAISANSTSLRGYRGHRWPTDYHAINSSANGAFGRDEWPSRCPLYNWKLPRQSRIGAFAKAISRISRLRRALARPIVSRTPENKKPANSALFATSREISVCARLRGGARRTRTSDQTIISRYSERGLRARNLRGPCCSNAFRKKAKHLALAGPLRWQVNPFPSLNQAPPVLYCAP